MLKKDRKPQGYNRVIRQYKQGAKDRNISWEITNEQCYSLFQQKCFYCGSKPATRRSRGVSPTNGKRYYTSFFNGIDRINNKEGYILYNVVTCCATCNFMKGKLELSIFIKQIKRIARRSLKWKKS